MLLVDKDRNFEEQLLDLCENDATKFELISLSIDWVLQRIDNLHDDALSALEVGRNAYIIQVRDSFCYNSDLFVLFEYKRDSDRVTLLSCRDAS